MARFPPEIVAMTVLEVATPVWQPEPLPWSSPVGLALWHVDDLWPAQQDLPNCLLVSKMVHVRDYSSSMNRK